MYVKMYFNAVNIHKKMLLRPVFYLRNFDDILKNMKETCYVITHSIKSVRTNNAVQQIEKGNLPMELASLYFNLLTLNAYTMTKSERD